MDSRHYHHNHSKLPPPPHSQLLDHRVQGHGGRKYRCRMLGSWQYPDDIKFGKKICEQFRPDAIGDDDRPVKHVEYFNQPSRELGHDPRDIKSLLSLQQNIINFLPCYPSIESNWIGGEPAKCVFIDQISPKQVHNNLNLVTLLEDISNGDHAVSIKSVNLLNIKPDRSCASVLFESGFVAWEFVRKFWKDPKFGWSVKIDNNGESFDKIFKKVKDMEREKEASSYNRDRRTDYKREKVFGDKDQDRDREYKNENENKKHYHDNSRSTDHYPYSHSRTRTNATDPEGSIERRKCSPFVPCLTIPFSCESKLSFKLDESVLLSLFPISKFPTFSNVEMGSSSWHIHFGREVDVVEADRMLQEDTFYWKSHEFFFERWYLRKNGRSWNIPEHYTNRPRPPEKVKETQLPKETSEVNERDTKYHPSLDINNKLYMREDSIFNNEDMIDREIVSSLPKFIKKRTLPCGEELNDCQNVENVYLQNDSNNNVMDDIKVKIEEKEADSSSNISKEINEKTGRIKISDKDVKEQSASIKGVKFKVKRTTAVKKKPNLKVEVMEDVSICITEDSHGTEENEIENDNDNETIKEKITGSSSAAFTSARTQGYFVLNPEVKAKVKFPGILEAFSTTTESSKNNFNSNSTLSASRSTRAQNRRPLTGQQTSNFATDLFKVSPLQSTQKLVVLRNSSIHSYGLVLMEPAEPGELIIEYVGELVRATVANIREWHYEREYRGDGIASSYLFRLDNIMVIDATTHGNLARFINHSCDPNCVAKTITLNGSKRIVMYSKRSIRVGEEITYDYKFPTENDPKKKVKCLCGSSICRKTLN